MIGVAGDPACDRARAHISVRLDGELSELGETRLRAHLAACAGCRAFELELIAATEALRKTPLDALSRPIVLPRRRRAFLREVRLAAAAVALAAVGLGSLYGGLHSARLLTPTDTAPRAASARPAFLDSAADYDLRLIEQARDARSRIRGSAIPL